MRKILLGLALALIGATCAHAQTTIAVSASNILNGPGGGLLPRGALCFQATDQNNVNIGIQVGGGGMVVMLPYCSAVVNGVVTGFSVPNPANTSPTNVRYRITVQVGQQIIAQFPGSYLCNQTGACTSPYAFNFDTCISTSVCIANPIPIVSGPGGPPGANGATGATGAAGPINQIYNNGSSKPVEPHVDLIGAGVSCVDNSGATKTDCTFTSANAFPVTVTGGVSGGIPCFTSTTTEAASTLLAAGNVVIGNGAGICPTASTALPNGITGTTQTAGDTTTKLATDQFVATAVSSVGGTPAFPVTVTGGVSGGIPCFTSTSIEAVSTLLAVNQIVLGGGAGVCPSSSTALPNGITATTQSPGDNTNKVATDAFVLANAGGGGGSNVFPLTVAGTVNSGGVPCFTSTTNEASSAALAANSLVIGGGAGGCVTGSTAIPNGTTATTQAPGDATLKVATDAFVAANGTINSGSQFSFAEYTTAGTALSSGPTPPTTNGNYLCGYAITASAAAAPTCPKLGSLPRNVTGTTDTILYSDNGRIVVYQGTAAVAVTLPTPTTLINTAFFTVIWNNTSGPGGTVTVTPTTFTVNGGSTLGIVAGQECRFTLNPGSATDWLARCSSTGGGGSSNPTVLDCSTYSGADFGAKVNACLAALPAAGGVADVTNFTSPQTLSTAVVNSYSAVIQSCGLSINQGAKISLSGIGSSWEGCPNQLTIFTKTANIDQFELAGSNNQVEYVNLDGQRGGGKTGNGIVIDVSAYGPYISRSFVQSEDTDDILDDGSLNATFKDLVINDYGVNGLVLTASWVPVGDNIQFYDAAGSTGNAMSTPGVIIGKFSNLFMSLSGGAPGIENDSGGRLFIDHSFLSQNGGYPAYKTTSGAVHITGTLIAAGGAHGPAIDSIGPLYLVNNPQISNAVNTGNIINASGEGIVITGNGFIFTRNSGQSAININAAPTIGAMIRSNSFYFNAGDSPSGDNYAIRFTLPASGDYLQNDVSENTFYGNNHSVDHGIYFDNTAGNITANYNHFMRNECIDFSSATCIVITDTVPNRTEFESNNTNLGSSGLFSSGGNAGAVITQVNAPFSFSNLPTAAADGSVALCTDCTVGSPVAGSGPGGMLYRQGGVWRPNQSIVGYDDHTAEITGNYGATTLISNTAATGFYLVTVYVEVSTSVATSTITTTVSYHDDTGANSQAGALLSGATAGTIQTLTFPVRFVTGTALTYATSTANSPKYKIFARAQAQ